MLKIIRWFFGYVLFCSKNALPEKFINMVTRAGINLWNIKSKNGDFSACILANEYKSLRFIAKRSGLRIKVKKKYGLPFIINKYKNRYGLFIGFILFFVILKLFSMFIWVIDVKGIKELNENQVKSELAALGIMEGSLKSKLDIPLLEQRVMVSIPDISWISINITGCVAEVSLTERVKAPELVKEGKPCNVKAMCDGQIDSMEIYKGMAVVNNGDAVVKGQLLVSGVIQREDGSSDLQHADAKVKAYTKKVYKERVPVNQTKCTYTGKEINRRSIKIFELEFPLTFNPKPKGDYEVEYKKKDVKIFDRVMPIKIYNQKFRECSKEKCCISETDAMQQLEDIFLEKEKTKMKDIEILNREKRQFVSNEFYYMEIKYSCKENIAQKEEMILE